MQIVVKKKKSQDSPLASAWGHMTDLRPSEQFSAFSLSRQGLAETVLRCAHRVGFWSRNEKLSAVPLREQAVGGKKLTVSGLLRKALFSVFCEVLGKLPSPPSKPPPQATLLVQICQSISSCQGGGLALRREGFSFAAFHRYLN